jgi:hypothetical protein
MDARRTAGCRPPDAHRPTDPEAMKMATDVVELVGQGAHASLGAEGASGIGGGRREKRHRCHEDDDRKQGDGTLREGDIVV